MRKLTWSPLNILLANLMWILVVFPYHLVLSLISRIPGHSSSLQ